PPQQQHVHIPFQQPGFYLNGSISSSGSLPSTPQELNQHQQPQMMPNGFQQAQMFYQGSNSGSSTSFANYTTNAQPPMSSSSSSFSMPSVQSQQHQQQQAVFYGPDSGNVSPTANVNGPSGVTAGDSSSKRNVYEAIRAAPTSIPQAMHQQQMPQGMMPVAMAYQNQNASQTHIQDYPHPLTPVAIANPTDGLQSGTQFATFHRILHDRNGSGDDVPFPGILNPEQRQFQPYNSNNNFAQQRSATYPMETSSSGSSVGIVMDSGRKGSTPKKKSESYCGMSLETAARNRCNICGKQFKRPSSLQTHKYSHSGEKPFQCDWKDCNKVFSVRSNMIRHRKLHVRDEKINDGSEASDASSSVEPNSAKNETASNGQDSHAHAVLPAPVQAGSSSQLDHHQQQQQQQMMARQMQSQVQTPVFPQDNHSNSLPPVNQAELMNLQHQHQHQQQQQQQQQQQHNMMAPLNHIHQQIEHVQQTRTVSSSGTATPNNTNQDTAAAVNGHANNSGYFNGMQGNVNGNPGNGNFGFYM
ncbi:hypothetical protein WICPIJ_009354, partial [Wickerhamomyces pijperi]